MSDNRERVFSPLPFLPTARPLMDTPASHSLDVGLATFDEHVIAESHRRPVLVDFWAAWCGPCRVLKPVLEQLATEYAGRFLLAKVDTEAEPQLAAQFGIRGIPLVKAFVDGVQVDEFSGALPPAQVRAFIERLLPSEADLLRQRAVARAAGGDAEGAIEDLQRALDLDPRLERARIDLIGLLLDANRLDDAHALAARLQPLTPRESWAAPVLARLALQPSTGADLGALESRLQANADDHEARLALARQRVAAGHYEAALEHLLELVGRNRRFEDDAGRRTMISIFDLLAAEPAHAELVSRYRRALARALN